MATEEAGGIFHQLYSRRGHYLKELDLTVRFLGEAIT